MSGSAWIADWNAACTVSAVSCVGERLELGPGRGGGLFDALADRGTDRHGALHVHDLGALRAISTGSVMPIESWAVLNVSMRAAATSSGESPPSLDVADAVSLALSLLADASGAVVGAAADDSSAVGAVVASAVGAGPRRFGGRLRRAFGVVVIITATSGGQCHDHRRSGDEQLAWALMPRHFAVPSPWRGTVPRASMAADSSPRRRSTLVD